MYNIALAIGHNYTKKTPNGSPDRGASASYTTEADTIKAIVDEIVKKGIPGFTIEKVPEGLDIKGRNKWVNDRSKNLHAYFEFHLDAAQQSATGCRTYFVSDNNWAEWEAKQFQMEYTRITWLKWRGVAWDKTNRWGRLGAIRDIKIFGLLMELGFITNPRDLEIVKKKWVEWIISWIQKMFAS